MEERRNGASVRYAYDKVGNRIRKTDAQGEMCYLYDQKNQLIVEGGNTGRKEFIYDRQGGIIEERNPAGTRTFSYDNRHQQVRVKTEAGDVQENHFDSEKLRFELLENGRRANFVYHNSELLYEEGREEGQTSYHLGLGINAFHRNQQNYYYQQDEQLSMAFITDGQGVVQDSYLYDAFGNMLDSEEQIFN